MLRFNEFINNQDIRGLSELLAEDTKLIMGDEVTQSNKEEAIRAWLQFFKMFPDYKNHFSRIESKEETVSIAGYSTCSNKTLDGPALWRARIENDLISEWQVLADSKDNRRLLKLSTSGKL